MDENQNRGKVHFRHAILPNRFFHLSPLLNISFEFIELACRAWSQNIQFCLFFKIHHQMANILSSMIEKNSPRFNMEKEANFILICALAKMRF